jgi:hypothetical protein
MPAGQAEHTRQEQAGGRAAKDGLDRENDNRVDLKIVGRGFFLDWGRKIHAMVGVCYGDGQREAVRLGWAKKPNEGRKYRAD